MRGKAETRGTWIDVLGGAGCIHGSVDEFLRILSAILKTRQGRRSKQPRLLGRPDMAIIG